MSEIDRVLRVGSDRRLGIEYVCKLDFTPAVSIRQSVRRRERYKQGLTPQIVCEAGSMRAR